MPVLKANTITKAKLGSTDLKAVYRGSTQIWQAGPPPPFIFAPINMEPVKAYPTEQYHFWVCCERQEELPYLMWFEKPEGVGTDPAKAFTNVTQMIDPATGKQGKCVVDGHEYAAYNTNWNDFAEKDDCDWIFKLRIKFLEYGWTPYSVILKGGIDDPNNPCYRDDRFPDLSTFYMLEESELDNG